MKSLLQNLLMFFALCLCGLVAWQWARETGLRKQAQTLAEALREQSQTIQSLQAQVRRDEAEIQRLDGLKNELTASIEPNREKLAGLGRALDQAVAEKGRSLEQLARYKDALQSANTNITRQNEQIKELAEGRDALVQKFNKLAADYADLINKWNRQQETLIKAASTNAPVSQ